MKFKAGDRVRITDNLHHHGFKIGDVVTIIYVSDCDYEAYDIHKTSACGDYMSWYFTDEECEAVTEYEPGDVVTHNDNTYVCDSPMVRKLTNYHIGDRVRVIDNLYGHSLTMGKVYTIFDMLTKTQSLSLLVIDEDGEVNALDYDEVEYVGSCSDNETPVQIEISFDGKHTVATMYRNGEAVTATADCGSFDNPDWFRGASIALSRLV